MRHIDHCLRGITIASIGSAVIYYSYDPYGMRVFQQPWSSNTGFDTPSQLYFYGISGQKLATFTCGPGESGLICSTATFNLYFAGKLIRSNGVTVATDRLGSVRGNVNGERMSYYPYGQERTSTADGREKFGTYLRDGAGQDYADQRYYNQQGAFWSPDPGGLKTANTAIPFSWNRYAYVYGDPVNYTDRHGREVDDDPGDGGCWVDPDDGTFHCSVTGTGNGDGGGGGGESCDDNPFQAQCDAGPVNPGSDTGVGGKPVSDKDRLRDTIWMQQDFRALKAFNPKAGPCQTDLSRFNLSGSQIHSIASSTKLVDVSSLPAGCQQQFDPGMDMTAVANSNTGATFIVYNANNFWQAASSQMSGTLLHEIIHLASSSFNDQTIASKLGVTITSTNTSAISLKLAKDCF